MSLQIALVFLGALALILIIVVSYINNRLSLGGRSVSIHRIIGLSKRLSVKGDTQTNLRHSYREPSLVPANQFRLEPIAIKKFQEGEKLTQTGTSTASNDIKSKLVLDKEFGKTPLKIDYWAKLTGTTTASYHDALSIFRHHEPQYECIPSIYGRSQLTKGWSNIEEGGSSDVFTDLVVSVQLAGDRGAITESELTRTNNLIYDLAERFDRKCQFNMTAEEAIIHAINLDRFCKNYDLLVITIISSIDNSQFSYDTIQQLAEECDMYMGNEGMFHFSTSDSVFNGFTLADRVEPGRLDTSRVDKSATSELVLFMSVPRVEDPVSVYDQMVDTALHMGAKLSGRLLDPDGDPISKNDLLNIREQVGYIQEIFRRVGIDAGSRDALRLF
ncbi:MAG: hypothetical protein CL398_00545 [Acidiferrobacteraceae bacterium]|nr:hypothetical protein [Acidiferrobacteraceae bacterium]